MDEKYHAGILNSSSIKSHSLILYDFSMKTMMITDMKSLKLIACGIHFYY